MKISNDVLPGIIDRIRNHGASLGAEAKALGMSYRTTLITALREFMGREKYDELIAGKRPRTSSGADISTVLVQDTNVPVIFGTPTKDGWGIRYPLSSPLATFLAPDGAQYVRAADNANADLIVDYTAKGWGRIRLRKARGSERVDADRTSPVHHVPLVKGGTALVVDLDEVVRAGIDAVQRTKKKPLKAAKKSKRGSK